MDPRAWIDAYGRSGLFANDDIYRPSPLRAPCDGRVANQAWAEGSIILPITLPACPILRFTAEEFRERMGENCHDGAAISLLGGWGG